MPSKWVEKRLAEFEDLNVSCARNLHRLLGAHGVRLTLDGEGSIAQSRGTAAFALYDPWSGCLRQLPNSFKYFRTARGLGLITLQQGLKISRSLIKCCSALRAEYKGGFSEFFLRPQIASFLDCPDNELSFIEIAKGDCPDVFYQNAPWPVQADYHLKDRTDARIDVEKAFSTSGFTATVDAIEFACLGPWIGLGADDLCKVIASLQPNSEVPRPTDLVVNAHKMTIPFFSQGFQGVVVGIFCGIDDKIAEVVRTELLQFGQALADRWSLARLSYFWEAMRERDGDASPIAQALAQLVSPVQHLIVRHKDTKDGYQFVEEGGYWAGLRRLEQHEIDAISQADSDIVMNDIPDVGIAIRLLPSRPVFDAIFARNRIEMLFQHSLPCIQGANQEYSVGRRGEILTRERIDKILETLKKKAAGSTSVPAHRRLFVAEILSEHLPKGTVTISNEEFRNYLTRLGLPTKHGYQITSHIPDLGTVFSGMVRIEKVSNSIALSWEI